MTRLVLIDLSSIAYPIWMVSASEPDPNTTSTKIVARVRALAAGQPHVAVCCDKGRSFRHDVSKEYKANRPEREAALHHQIDLACDRLKSDGFPVWAIRGFEADDLIASATVKALSKAELDVLIISSDKDLLQLVGERVTAMSARDGSVLDAEAVKMKLGVRPDQVRDYLTLVGDASDNVKGAKNIGPKRAVELLSQFGNIDALYARLDEAGGAAIGLTPSVSQSLRDFKATWPTTRRLITLSTDAGVPLDEALADRMPQDIPQLNFADEAPMDEPQTTDRENSATEAATAIEASPESGTAPAATVTAIATRDPEILGPAPAEWERQLDPRSLRDAKALATDMFNSRMFSAYGNQQAVLSTIMVGRELGLPAMASLRSVHVIEGRHSLAASLMVALVLRSGLAEFFEPVSFSELEATYETKRANGRNAIKLTHTIEMAKQAWPKSKADWEKAWLHSGWGRNPTDMLVARATARLARMVYPDLLAGLYTPEELEEIRQSQAA